MIKFVQEISIVDKTIDFEKLKCFVKYDLMTVSRTKKPIELHIDTEGLNHSLPDSEKTEKYC